MNNTQFKLKHITDLNINDEVIITIPGVTDYTGKVTFINLEHNFILLDVEEEQEYSTPFKPNSDGYFKILLHNK